jgi:hypothetical protein
MSIHEYCPDSRKGTSGYLENTCSVFARLQVCTQFAVPDMDSKRFHSADPSRDFQILAALSWCCLHDFRTVISLVSS